jgi:hypothetical protein
MLRRPCEPPCQSATQAPVFVMLNGLWERHSFYHLAGVIFKQVHPHVRSSLKKYIIGATFVCTGDMFPVVHWRSLLFSWP